MTDAIQEPVGLRGVRIFPGVLEAEEAEEKHDRRRFSASTPAQLYRAALHLLRERRRDGWYLDPEPGDPPQDVRWHQRMLRCLEMDGAERYRAGTIAWELLQAREGHEYEHVEFVPLEAVDGSEDRLEWLCCHWHKTVPDELVPDGVAEEPLLQHVIKPFSVGDVFTALRAQIGGNPGAFVSRMIETHATAMARGPRPDLPPGTPVVWRRAQHVTAGEVHGRGGAWCVALAGHGHDVLVRQLHVGPLHRIVTGSSSEDFGGELVRALHEAGLRCAPYALPGDDLHDAAHPEIVPGAKWLLVCSEEVLSEWWVQDLIAHLMGAERRGYEDGGPTSIIIPIVLDSFLFDRYQGRGGAFLRRRQAADFRGWTRTRKVDPAAVMRLIDGLRGERTPAPRPKL